MTDDDPLEGVGIMESRTVEHIEEIHSVDVQPHEWYGSDRQRDITNISVELTQDEYGETVIEVTTEAELTKCLSPRWDQANAPRTEQEERQARRKRWGQRVAHFIPAAMAFGIAGVVSYAVMDSLSGNMNINGEPVTAPVPELWATIMLMVFVIWVILYGVSGGLPGKVMA